MLQCDREKYYKFIRGQICNHELLIGEDEWNLFERVQKALFEGKTVLLTDNGVVVATMYRHPIDGYIVKHIRR